MELSARVVVPRPIPLTQALICLLPSCRVPRSLSLPLAPESPSCTHMVSHIALPYLPFCGGHPLTCLCMSWPGTLDPFHALPAAIRTLHLPAALPQLGWARRQL